MLHNQQNSCHSHRLQQSKVGDESDSMSAGSVSSKNDLLHRKRERRLSQQFQPVSGLEGIFRDVGVGVAIKAATKPEVEYGSDSDLELTSSATSLATTTTTTASLATPDASPANRPADPLPPEVSVSYDFDWVFRGLRKPSLIWYFFSQVVIFAVGLFSKFILGK